MTAAAEALAVAIGHHQGGRLQAAEQVYRQILAREPDNTEARLHLGAIAYQTGRLDEAVACWQIVAGQTPNFAPAHYNLGLAYKDQGKLDEAARSWRRALEIQPDAQTHNNLGNVLREQGKLDEAIASYRRAIELQPDVARPHYNLGNALRDLDKLDEAAASYRRALVLAPEYAEAHSNLGNVLRRQGKLDEAIAAWRRTVALKPDFAEAHFNLSVAYTDQENFAEVIACCRRALALKPDFAEANNNLGNALRKLGNLDEAVVCCRRAIALKPGLAEAHNNLGSALKHRGESNEASACYRRAIELSPNFAKAHYNLGTVLEQSGDLQQAEECFRQALRHEPRFALAHYNLANLRRGKLADDELAALRSLLAVGDLQDAQRMFLHFSLGEVLDARGDYTAAAEHLERANALQLSEWTRCGRTYDPDDHERLVARLVELSAPGFFERLRGFGSESELPVFVVGLPRSGTTLIEQILAAHSRVFAAGEIKLVHETLALAGQGRGQGTVQGTDFIEGLRRMDGPMASRLAAGHLERLRVLNGNAFRIVDKLPDNYLYLGPLAALFPRAKFIHCRRDLRDVAVSCWMTHFQEVPWANDQQHLVSRFHQYQRMIAHWRKVLPAPMLELDYEETVADLESAARRLVAFCGLEWEPRCLDFHRARRPISTASAVQVRQPIYTTSVARWRHYEQPLAALFADISVKMG